MVPLARRYLLFDRPGPAIAVGGVTFAVLLCAFRVPCAGRVCLMRSARTRDVDGNVARINRKRTCDLTHRIAAVVAAR